MADKKPLSKSALLSALSEKTNLTKKDVDAFLEALTEIAYKEAKSVGKFTLPGFGILKLVQRAARMGRNPATGENIKIKASRKAKITPLKAFKDAALTGKMAASKVAAKPAAKKAVAKKAPAKKAPAKKAPAKKAVAKKAPAKKAPARKTAAKKTTAKKR